jgi:hypothetical protein
MTTVSNLEKAVIERFLADPAVKPNKRSVDFEAVNVSSREFTGAGFLTDFQRTDELKLFDESVSLRWGKVGARLNASQTDTGYLVYIDEGYLSMIEGYTYGEDWPVEVEQLEIYDLEQTPA